MVCIFFVHALPQRMAKKFMLRLMVKEPSEFGLVLDQNQKNKQN